jgi:hypothetical protein
MRIRKTPPHQIFISILHITSILVTIPYPIITIYPDGMKYTPQLRSSSIFHIVIGTRNFTNYLGEGGECGEGVESFLHFYNVDKLFD